MKRELVEIKKYCESKSIEMTIFSVKTGDGWVSPLGMNIYVTFSEIDEWIKTKMERFKKGIYPRSYVLKSVGGHKYRLTAKEQENLLNRADQLLSKYQTWIT